MTQEKITSFTQLKAWQEGHQLVLRIYEIAKAFPQEERYALGDQMRRAAVSITSNIAEGFSRQSKKEKVQFYAVANGSATEIQNQLLIARDVGYLSQEDFQEVADQTVTVRKLLNGLMTSIRNSVDGR